MQDKSYISIQAPPLPYFLECGKALYAPGDQHVSRYRLGVFDLLFVTKGALYIGEEERHWSLTPGQYLLLLPDRHHYAVKPCDSETAFYWLHFQVPGKWEVNGSADIPASGDIIVPQQSAAPDAKELGLLMNRLLRLSGESRNTSFWEQHLLFGELLRRLDEGRRTENVPAAKLLAHKTEAYLKQNYASPISNETLAEALHFHPGYIVRCYKIYYGCTPMDYLHKFRLDQAKLLLVKTDWPIGKIAEHAGFSSTAYFTSCFRKETGTAPLRYRNHFAR
ncbi:helix-turn-helix transcriptional regulator [Paenibacillus ginsengarvi]|uniref:AraC family transcriptional regulator n=1 Tax=Paenibacillus ginsengarvi TaxID=400777 RepID=A0A3B0CSU9_9BACL|nr:AraC family transcriptional regulator [Paenibacillus ginsengarvi]RKN86329.1 AraC family transcriptional regulator [Paenibacillus ginsengarvi]